MSLFSSSVSYRVPLGDPKSKQLDSTLDITSVVHLSVKFGVKRSVEDTDIKTDMGTWSENHRSNGASITAL